MARFSTSKSSEYIEEFFSVVVVDYGINWRGQKKIRNGRERERGRESKQAKIHLKTYNFRQSLNQERQRETEKQRDREKLIK